MKEIVAIYGRVSTQEQAREGYSLGEQESRLRLFAESHGWTVGACYMDAGLSGKDLNRPGLQALIRDAEAHRVTKVLVYKLDRLSRRQKDTLYLIEDVFIRNHVDFVSLSETLDTSTPLGIAMIGVLSVFAQLERENIKERMTIGRDARIKEGRYRNSAGVPLGYRRVDKHLEVDPYESALLRDMFTRYLAGDTVTNIANDLTLSKVRGRVWNASHVRLALSQTIYVGRQRWKGEEYRITDLEPLIDETTFEAVQQELDRRSMRRDKPLAPQLHTTLLGGMIWCGECGNRYYAVSKKKNGETFHRYFCWGRAMNSRSLIPCSCTNKSRLASQVNNMVIDEIRKLSIDRSTISNIVTLDPTAPKRAGIESRLAEISRQLDKLIDLYTIDGIDIESLSRRTAALKEESAELKNQLDALKPTGRQTRAQLESTLNDFDAALKTSGPDYMNLYHIIRKLLKAVIVTSDGVRLEWNI